MKKNEFKVINRFSSESETEIREKVNMIIKKLYKFNVEKNAFLYYNEDGKAE